MQIAVVNYRLFELINSAAGRIDTLDDVLEFAATWLIYASFLVAGVLTVLSLRRGRVRPVVQFGVALFLAFGAAVVLAHLSVELRPFQSHAVHQLIPHDPGVSLPSDHATAAFTLAFGVFAFLSRGWGVTLIVAALIIGFARVWVGVHYPGDILAGAVIGGLAVLQVVAADRCHPARPGARHDRV